MDIKGTTIVAVQKDGKCALAGDGQVTLGEATIMKHTARKVRRIYNDSVVVGFAGGVADAFTLCDRFEAKLTMYGDLVFVGVDDTFRPTIFQTVSESSQSSREYNVFQFGAICKGLRVNGFYLFRDGDGLEF